MDFDAIYDEDNDAAAVTGLSQIYNVTAGMWTFTATYGDNTGSDAFLAQPPTYDYEPYTYDENHDYDVGDADNPPVPYCNTAGVPFAQPLPIERIGIYVTVRVPAHLYDATAIFDYGNRINSTTLTFPDNPPFVVPARKAKFIAPRIQSRSADASYQWINLRFDVRPSGWDKNVIDAGETTYGKVGDGGDPGLNVLGPILTNGAVGGPAGQVYFDGAGKPIKPIFGKVADIVGNPLDLVGPTEPAASADRISPNIADGGLTTYNESTHTGIVVLSFKRNLEADLNELLP